MARNRIDPMQRPGATVVRVANRQRKLTLDPERAFRVAGFVLESLGQAGSELSVVFVSDRAVTRLNRTYLGKNHATDVLAFSQREGEGCTLHPGVLGDVIISVETAAVQAEESGTSFLEELDLLLIHGILHLLGYDHTVGGKTAERMVRKQGELFRKVRKRFPEQDNG